MQVVTQIKTITKEGTLMKKTMNHANIDQTTIDKTFKIIHLEEVS